MVLKGGGGGGGGGRCQSHELIYIVSCATYNNITHIIIFVVIDASFQGIVCNCQAVD